MKKISIFILDVTDSTTLLRLIMDPFTNIGCPSETKFIYNLLKIKPILFLIYTKTKRFLIKNCFLFLKTIEKFIILFKV